MSDDLSMQALSGTFRERAEAAFAAGCDMVLHCNGDMDEMVAVAEAAPVLAGEPLRRAEAALAAASATCLSRSILWTPAPGSTRRLR